MKRLISLIIGITAGLLAVLAFALPACASTGSQASGVKANVLTPATGGPVLGWNSWYEYGSGVTEANVLAQAHAMVSDGLAAKGYNTVVIDDGWQALARNAAGNLTWNTAKFPDGIPALASQLHSMGLKFGIYTAIGNQTCVNYAAAGKPAVRAPGSGGISAVSSSSYQRDAATFKSWGADFVKVDDCKWSSGANGTAAQLTADFKQFGAYITADGMQYSQELPVLMPIGSTSYLNAVSASRTFSSMWRVAPDEHFNDSAYTTVIGHLQADVPLYGYASANHWNDLDMVVPGVVDSHPFGFTQAQWQAQLSVWAMEASPLIMSTNLASTSATEAQAVADLGNPHMIAIDQSGTQASHKLLSGSVQTLTKGADGGVAVMLANTAVTAKSVNLTLAQLSVNFPHATAYNVWTGKTVTLKSVATTLASGQVALFVLKSIP